MSLTQTPSVLYESIQRTLAVCAGPPRRRFPLPQNSPIQFAAYAFDQEFEMLLANFPPAPKNTPSNAAGPVFAGLLDANAILTKLGQPTATGGGKGKFTGSFAVVPASWDDFITQNVNFPGWLNTITDSNGFRDALPRLVTVRLHYDYFVVDPAGILTGAGVKDSGGSAIQVVTSQGAIPLLLKTPWLNLWSVNGVAPFSVLPFSEAKSLTPSAGTTGYYPTLPSIQQYKSWCAVAVAFIAGGAVWNSTSPPVWDGVSTVDVSSGQYRLDDSKMQDYEGNIIARVTPYVMMR